MAKSPNLQDVFLASARRTETQVTVFLVNGFQMRGTITGFDAFTVVLTIAPGSRPYRRGPWAYCSPWAVRISVTIWRAV